MGALRKYPDELRERAVRLVLDAKAEPGSSGKTCASGSVSSSGSTRKLCGAG
jgi:transposase-like protein